MTILRIGTSIAKDMMPGYPALEKIFQNGTRTPTTKNPKTTSSSGKPIDFTRPSF
jgi:hypothetical protein